MSPIQHNGRHSVWFPIKRHSTRFNTRLDVILGKRRASTLRPTRDDVISADWYDVRHQSVYGVRYRDNWKTIVKVEELEHLCP